MMLRNRDNLVLIEEGVRYTGRFIACPSPRRPMPYIGLDTHRPLPFIASTS